MNKLPYFFTLIVLLASLLGAPAAQAQERRGWSPQAKGAVIGGGSGAILGAIINKRNRAVGGIVGGVAGAGVGYAIGKHTDNKRKERARIAAANRAEAIREANYRTALRRSEDRRLDDRRETLVSTRTQTTVVPANSLVAPAPGAPQPAMNTSATPAASNAAYLPNETYGDATKPYGATEVRHKSW